MLRYLCSCPNDIKMIRRDPALHRQEVEDDLTLFDNLDKQKLHIK